MSLVFCVSEGHRKPEFFMCEMMQASLLCINCCYEAARLNSNNYLYSGGRKMLNFCQTERCNIENILIIENDFSDFVGQWTYNQHLEAIASDDVEHISFFDESNKFIGYAILKGLLNPNRSIELMRITVATPNRGFGKIAIFLLQEWCFKKLNAHRLWLDVREHNVRAQYVYKSMGFITEGLLRDAVFHNGKYESLIIMSILEDEFNYALNKCNRNNLDDKDDIPLKVQ